MVNIKKLGKGMWDVLRQPADECGIFPIYARVAIYGLLLFIILNIQSSHFDSTELITLISFVSIFTMLESMWKKARIGRRLWWHFTALILLMCLLGVLLHEAIHVREAWYRTHILEKRIETLICTAPTAIIVSDGQDHIKYINKHTMDLIGYSNEELVGKPLTILMRPSRIKTHTEAFNKTVKILKGGSAEWIYTDDHIFRIVTKDKTIIKAYIYIVGVRYSSDMEPGTYPPGKEVEFYGIIIPFKPIPPEDDYQ